MASIITYVSVAVFIQIVTKPLLPGYIVFVIAYYMRLCGSVVFHFIKSVTGLFAANVSCKRIQVNSRKGYFKFY
jgi:hypothetical protein